MYIKCQHKVLTCFQTPVFYCSMFLTHPNVHCSDLEFSELGHSEEIRQIYKGGLIHHS